MIDLAFALCMILIPVSSNEPEILYAVPESPSIVTTYSEPSFEFMIGIWRYSDHFFKWGNPEESKPVIRKSADRAVFDLRKDGTVKSANIFSGEASQWSVEGNKLLISSREGRNTPAWSMTIQIRDQDHIWLLYPYANGSAGIGLERVPSERAARLFSQAKSAEKRTKRKRVSWKTRPKAINSQDFVSSTDLTETMLDVGGFNIHKE